MHVAVLLAAAGQAQALPHGSDVVGHEGLKSALANCDIGVISAEALEHLCVGFFLVVYGMGLSPSETLAHRLGVVVVRTGVVLPPLLDCLLPFLRNCILALLPAQRYITGGEQIVQTTRDRACYVM